MKAFLEFMAMFGLNRIFDLVRDIAKGYIARFYIGIIDVVRSIYFVVIGTFLCFLLVFSGFILLHVALFLSLSWTMSDKIILMLILGGTYISIPAILMVGLQSRNLWLNISGAKKMLEDASGKK